MRLAPASCFSSPVRHYTDRNARVPLTADCTYKLAPEPRIGSFQDTSAYMFTGHERMTGGVLNAGQGRDDVRRRKERGYKSAECEGPTFAPDITLSDFHS